MPKDRLVIEFSKNFHKNKIVQKQKSDVSTGLNEVCY